MPKSTVRTTYSVHNTILSRQGPWQAATVVISAADVTADADGRKIVPAGTLLGPTTSFLTILGDGQKAKPANDATTEGLTMNAVDVTNGDMEVAMLFMGTVGLDRIADVPAAGTIAVLPRVTFTKD